MSLGKWQFPISSASPNDGGDISKMPAIKMELLRSYRYDEILAAAREYQVRSEFVEKFPQILSGELDQWFLWNVKFEIDRLTLQYFCREQDTVDEGIFGTEPRHGIGTVTVKDPTVLGLRFTMPENIGEQSGCIYECMMSSSGSGQSHSIQLMEWRPDGHVTTTIFSTSLDRRHHPT